MFGELAVAYLFLGGASAAALLVLAALGLFVPRDLLVAYLNGSIDPGKNVVYGRFFSTTYMLSIIALVVSVLCLIADLGKPDHALMVLLSPTFSFMTLGAYALMISALASCFVFLAWLKVARVSDKAFRLVSVLLLVACFVVVVYTALLLGSLDSVPLWSNGWVPLLFVLSSVSCGLAYVVGSAQLSGAGRAFGTVLSRLMNLDACVIVLEALVFAGLIVSSSFAFGISFGPEHAAANGVVASMVELRQMVVGENAVEAAECLSLLILSRGPYASLLWGGVLFAGMFLPLLIECSTAFAIRRSRSRTVTFTSSMAMVTTAFCVLAGGALLRWCIVFAGVQPASLLGA